MKKISLVLLAITVMAVLAVSVAAEGTVMYKDGGANQAVVQGDSGALVWQQVFDGEDAENPQTFNVDDADYLYVRFYVEDADALTGNGSIEITSSGTCDQQEYSWNPFTYGVETGWNELELYIWEGGETGGTPDFTKINFFRIYLFTDGANALAVDYVGFGAEGEDFSGIATDIGEIVKEEVAPENSLKDSAEGDTLTTLEAVNRIPETICDITDYDYLYARIYVEGIDNFTGNGQFEICSKPSCDMQEIHWDVSGLELQDGWNDICLDTYLANAYDASFNRANAQYFRLYMFTEGTLKLELDYIGFGPEEGLDPADLPVYLVKPADVRAAEAPAEEAEEPAAEEPAAEAPAAEAPAEEAPAAEEPAAEEPAAEPETVEAPAAEPAAETAVAEAPATFDIAVVSAAAAIVASCGAYIATKKKR